MASVLPDSNQALLLNALGTAFPDVRRTLATSLKRAGWSTRSASATVTELRAIKGVGLLYLSAHGGAGVIHLVDHGQPIERTVSTLTTSTAKATNAATLNDIALGLIATASVVVDTGAGEVDRLCITPEFVRRYWSFARNAVVILDACWGAALPKFASVLYELGVSAVIGWSSPVGGTTAGTCVPFLVDRMCGANLIEAETPGNRPFAFQSVLRDMNRRQMFTFIDPAEQKRAVLKVAAGGSDDVLLAPSVERVTIFERSGNTGSKAIAEITGTFGEAPATLGPVLVDGKRLTPLMWESDKIVVELPDAGDGAQPAKGSCGPLRVSRQSIASNAVPLSLWRIRVQAEEVRGARAGGTVTANGVADAIVRLDVHPVRPECGDEPTSVDVTSAEVALGSSWSYRRNGNTAFTRDDKRYTASESAAFKQKTAAARGLQGGAMVNADARTMLLGLSSVATGTQKSGVQSHYTIVWRDGREKGENLLAFGPDIQFMGVTLWDGKGLPNGLPYDYLKLELKTGYAIKAGSRPAGAGRKKLSLDDLVWDGYLDEVPGLVLEARLSWAAVDPLFPPDSTSKDSCW